MANVLEIHNLSFSYESSRKILDGVSFDVEAGKYVAIIGHNGSGKSTLAKIITGLLSGYDGDLYLFGTKADKSNIKSLRSRVGIVFQNPDNQFVGSTVADDIAFGLENKNVPPEEMEAIIKEHASWSGMEKFLDREPSSLSGGQKQRVAIAGVLAMKPEIVIFDEATAMLDPKGKKEIREFIAKARRENPNITFLSITHDIEEANMADEIIVLDGGKLFLAGTPKAVFAYRDELRKINLDVPFVYKVRDELKALGVDLPDEVDSIEKLKEWL